MRILTQSAKKSAEKTWEKDAEQALRKQMISCGKRLPIYWVDTMKIVIIGNGKIGSNLAAVLVREGHDVTVVDCEEAHLRKSQNTLDVMCIEGNGATAETQLEAGVNKATLLIAATPYDELNILCCLIGKRLGAVSDLSGNAIGREEIVLCLREVGDLERLIGRVVYGSAGGRDLVPLRSAIEKLPAVKEQLAALPDRRGCVNSREIYLRRCRV